LSEEKSIPLSDLRGLRGGHAYISNRSQRRPAERYISEAPATQAITCKLSAISVSIPLDELVDISIFHPFGNQCKPVFAYSHSEKWQDIRMPEMFPSNTLPAESLRSTQTDRHDRVGGRLTLRMTSRSLVMYIRTTLTATRRPLYVFCNTLAKPPHSTSTAPSEQSGMRIDFGTTRFRLHVLQSSLNSSSRSRSDRV